MNPNDRGETRNLKLPSIVESIVQQEQSERYLFNKGDINRHQVPTGRDHPAIEHGTAKPGIMEVLRITNRDARYNSLKVAPEPTRSFHQIPSPDSDFRFSNIDDSRSSDRSSPYNDLSQDRSRSSSSSMPSSAEESNNHDDANIGFLSITDVKDELATITKSSPPEIANRAEKHKIDERRRRDEHKQLQNLLENMCRGKLKDLGNSHFENHWKDLGPQLVQAMTTGNGKKHVTKTAVLLAVIVNFVDLAKEIQTLQLENSQLRGKTQSDGSNRSEASGISTLSFSAKKRRRSSVVASL